MRLRYTCRNEFRRTWVARIKTGAQFLQNGLDYLEVDPDDQTKLTLYFINPLSDVAGYAPLSAGNFRITGGVRISNIRVAGPPAPSGREIVLTADRAGDFSTYTLRITSGSGVQEPPVWLDPLLAEIDFSFKINCPSDFDCRPAESASPLPPEDAAIDYLARDYASFRRLLLDRMSLAMPDWKERHPADMGVALAELLAYVGDRLSYKQDAVATEAYLGTARRRVSLTRHARLLDYPVSDGASARAWVHIAVRSDGDGLTLRGPDEVSRRAGAALVTRLDTPSPAVRLSEAQLEEAVQNGACVFEILHDLTLYEAHNEMLFYDWRNEGCRLPENATCAWLLDNVNGKRLLLRPGDVLIFEEKRSPTTGRRADADPARRHAVRLTYVHPEAQADETGARTPGAKVVDPLFPESAVVEIRWHEEDALPFDLCLHTVADPDLAGADGPVCVASGNIVLAEHGLSVEETFRVNDEKRFRPALTFFPVARQAQVRLTGKNGGLAAFDDQDSARSALHPSRELVRPALCLFEEGRTDRVWRPRRDLLASDAFAQEFVGETEEDGRVALRFGDGVQGRKPGVGQVFTARYRAGCGKNGNVGAETIGQLLIRLEAPCPAASDADKIAGIRNPLAAEGGADPETPQQIRNNAPQAFRIQERAVAAPDYADIAMRHPDIQQAAATVRWTGSWHTVYVTIDRRGGKPVDDAFIAEMKAYLDAYRMAGFDVEVGGPRYVPLDIACTVCVKPGYFASDVKKALVDVFSSRRRSDGGRGFFHPDVFTFGRPLYLSQFYAAALAVAGVAAVEVRTFQRLGKKAAGELAAGKLPAGRLEVLRLDNDPNFPENGKIEFTLREAHA